LLLLLLLLLLSLLLLQQQLLCLDRNVLFITPWGSRMLRDGHDDSRGLTIATIGTSAASSRFRIGWDRERGV